ncbi:MAG: hypothetical protein ACWGQW_08635 [bacterium]
MPWYILAYAIEDWTMDLQGIDVIEAVDDEAALQSSFCGSHNVLIRCGNEKPTVVYDGGLGKFVD